MCRGFALLNAVFYDIDGNEVHTLQPQPKIWHLRLTTILLL